MLPSGLYRSFPPIAPVEPALDDEEFEDVFEARSEAVASHRDVQRFHAVRCSMPGARKKMGERTAVGMDLQVRPWLGCRGPFVLEPEDRLSVHRGDELVGGVLDSEELLMGVEAAPDVDLQFGEVLAAHGEGDHSYDPGPVFENL